MSGPLKGLRVIEFQGIGPAPLAGQLLADLGAEVVVIARASGPADPADVNARGKRSIAVNLKTADGLAITRALIERADIVIEGFRPGVMERMGLGPDECLTLNPRLIYGRMTGWGQDGPLARTAGHDINYLGLTGLLSTMGPADRPPAPPLNLVADYGGGTMFLLLGMMAALFERQTSGKGQVIDAAMIDGTLALSGLLHAMMARGQWSEPREANLLDTGAPFYRTYECADGKFLAVGPLEPQFHAELLARAGLPAEHATDQMDPRRWPERRANYAAIFRTRTRDDWMALFEGSDACVSPVLSMSEARAHPHMTARGAFLDTEGVPQPAPAPRFSRSAPDTPAAPVAPGANTDTILAELGHSPESIASLKASGALT